MKKWDMNYEVASVEEVAARFRTVTRQRIHQLIHSYALRGDEETVAKMRQANEILKRERYELKYGYTKEEVRKCDAVWTGITNRVGKLPAYLDCTIEFVDLDHFKRWATTQVGFTEDGFELDKDILVKGSRVYSPDTCVFVPVEINSLFSGCYKAQRRGQYPLGVSFNRGSGSFVAQMSSRQDRGLDKYLGSFRTVEEAFACYKVAKEAKIRRLAEKWKDRIDPRTYEALMARTVEWDD